MDSAEPSDVHVWEQASKDPRSDLLLFTRQIAVADKHGKTAFA